MKSQSVIFHLQIKRSSYPYQAHVPNIKLDAASSNIIGNNHGEILMRLRYAWSELGLEGTVVENRAHHFTRWEAIAVGARIHGNHDCNFSR